jgi:hypothetical protein
MLGCQGFKLESSGASEKIDFSPMTDCRPLTACLEDF